MKMHWSLALVLALTGCVLTQSRLDARTKKPKEPEKEERAKDVVVDGELTNADLKDKVLTESFCKTYTYKMVKDRTYQIDLKSKAFDAFLRLENPKGEQVAADDDSGGGLDARIIYKAPESGDFTVCAMSLGGGSTGKFTLIVKDTTPPGQGEKAPKADGKAIELKNDKGGASHTGKLDQNDPAYKGKRHKMFTFNMEAGKTYQIDMKSTDFDSYLFLESPDGKLLAEDDDSGGFPDARIVLKAAVTGKHRIISTYFANSNGEFTLTIRQTDPAPEANKDGDKK